MTHVHVQKPHIHPISRALNNYRRYVPEFPKEKTPLLTTKAKINVICEDCGPLWVEHWQGTIRGKGLRGSINAYFTRVKYTYTYSVPLITLYTTCSKCCAKVMLESEGQFSLTYSSKRINHEMILVVTYKEVEEIVSSKVIILQGAFFNANTIQTVRKDGKWQKWELSNTR